MAPRCREFSIWLHARSDTVVPLGTLLGTARDAVMPPLQEGGQSITRAWSAALDFASITRDRAISLGLHDCGDGNGDSSRRSFGGDLAGILFRRLPKADFPEPISVVMAAYNEGKVIADTLRAPHNTDYKGDIENDRSGRWFARYSNCVRRSDQSQRSIRVALRLLQRENRGQGARVATQQLSAVRRWHRCLSSLPLRNVSATRCTTFARNRLPTNASVQFPGHAKSRISAQFHRALSGARIYLRLQSRSTRLRSLELHHCRAGRDQRHPAEMRSIKWARLSLQTEAEDTALTLSLHKHRQRIVYVPQAIARGQKRRRELIYFYSRGNGSAGPATCFAMSLETPRTQSLLSWNYRAAGLVQVCRGCGFPNHPRRHYTDGGSVFCSPPALPLGRWRTRSHRS